MSSKKTEPTKYDEAVAKARGDIATQGPASIAQAEDVSGLLSDSAVAMADIREKIRSGEWENSPQLLTIPKGKTLTGLLEGNGPDAEFVDDATGEVSYTKTWIVSKDGVRVSILSTVQLDKKLPPFVGGIVSITRGEDVRSGQRLYTEYAVAGPRRQDGQRRDWSTKPKQLTAAQSAEDLTK